MRGGGAGQAVVQFAQGERDNCNYAVKFFLDVDSFYAEAALYVACFPHLQESLSDRAAGAAAASSPLAGSEGSRGGSREGPVERTSSKMSAAGVRFLPQVEAMRDGVKGELVDPRGGALPPCIVMERGESLQEWSNRAEPDLFTALSVRPPP
jgi:hypothetical protein